MALPRPCHFASLSPTWWMPTGASGEASKNIKKNEHISFFDFFKPILPIRLLPFLPSRHQHLMTIPQTQPSKDLAAARIKASFPVHELTRYIHGSDAKITRRRELANIVSSDPVFSSNRYE